MSNSVPSPSDGNVPRRRRNVSLSTFLLLSIAAQTVPLSVGFSFHSLLRNPRCHIHSTFLLHESVTTHDDLDQNNESTLATTNDTKPQWWPLRVGITTMQITGFSFCLALLLIGWEDVSMSHPMRLNQGGANQESTGPTLLGTNTVRGLGFGSRERTSSLLVDVEPSVTRESIRSYNEVMLEHRSERVAKWQEWKSKHNGMSTSSFLFNYSPSTEPISRLDVETAVRVIQLKVVTLQESKSLANNFEWESLAQQLTLSKLHQELEDACSLLQQAVDYLPRDAREEIGFSWGSCAWRHCGALADAQEALDELDHLIGILEPFEALFVLDIAERSLRDILAVTTKYQDHSVVVPEYSPLQRRSDSDNGGSFDGTLDEEYLAALDFLRRTEDSSD